MNQFIGEYEVTLDAKGRFLVPVAFKKQLVADTANQFVICRGIEKCLTLYPLQTWEPLYNEISKLNQFDPKVRAFRRRFLNGVTQVELDNAGRMLLPKSLIEYAELGKDIVLASAVNQIEIWDADKYKQLFDASSAEDFSVLADEVMNKKKNAGDE
jgi:MraZ protein